MNCSPTGSESGLVSYWDFKEGLGTIVIDQTENGNDGIINAGATYSTYVPIDTEGFTNPAACNYGASAIYKKTAK